VPRDDDDQIFGNPFDDPAPNFGSSYGTSFDGGGDPALPKPNGHPAVPPALPATIVAQPNGRDHQLPSAPSRIELMCALDINAWATLDIPPEPKLLGDLITPSSRVFLVGRTGLGKTLLAHGMAGGMASGQGFLHWRAERPSRWLIIDGEMPTALLKARSIDVQRRLGVEIPPGQLLIYGLDRAEEFAHLFPGLGVLQPLNTEAGQQFVMKLANALSVEGIMFDNVMSLIEGDQKDEVPWSQTLPLVSELSKAKIAQVYLDHTGHNSERQYGTATKGWRMDTIGIMTSVTEQGREVAFTLSFDYPGKARRRVPENWHDFDPTIIRLQQDRWTSEKAERQDDKISPQGRLWYDALKNALCDSQTPGRTTRTAWFACAVRADLVEAITEKDTQAKIEAKRARLRKYVTELRLANIIGINGEEVTLLQAAQ
jgi:hypothetical protein